MILDEDILVGKAICQEFLSKYFLTINYKGYIAVNHKIYFIPKIIPKGKNIRMYTSNLCFKKRRSYIHMIVYLSEFDTINYFWKFIINSAIIQFLIGQPYPGQARLILVMQD